MSAILRQIARTLKSLIPLFENAERIEYPGQPGIGQFILVSDETAQEIVDTLQVTSDNVVTKRALVKICLFCKHFVFSPGDAGYSEYTPGYEASMDCNIHDLDIDLHAETEASYRKKLLTAQTCDDFVVTEQMRGVELIQVGNEVEVAVAGQTRDAELIHVPKDFICITDGIAQEMNRRAQMMSVNIVSEVEFTQANNEKKPSLKAEGLPPLTDWDTQAGLRG